MLRCPDLIAYVPRARVLLVAVLALLTACSARRKATPALESPTAAEEAVSPEAPAEPTDDLPALLARLEAYERRLAAVHPPAGGAAGPVPARASEVAVAEDAAADTRRGVRGARAGGKGEPPARCEQVCELSAAICDLSDRICDLAQRHEGEDAYRSACERAVADCERATGACDGCTE